MKTHITFPGLPEESVAVMGGNNFCFNPILHVHKETQLTLILSGSGKLQLNNYVQEYHPGDIYLIRAGQPHLFSPGLSGSKKHDNPANSPGAIHILFNYEDQFKKGLEFIEMEDIRKLFTLDDSFQVLACEVMSEVVAKKIDRVFHSSGLKRLLLFIDLLSYISVSVAGQLKSLSSGICQYKKDVSVDSRMDKVYAYALEHYAEKITLGEIASIAYLSPESFCKYFKKNATTTWSNYINTVRIKEVCRRLIQNGESISEVAYSCGFNSLTTFYRTFKKITGTSPGEYLRESVSKESVFSSELF